MIQEHRHDMGEGGFCICPKCGERNYGQASGKEWLQKELFDILNYMKVKCDYYPMQVTVPLTRDWNGEILDRFTTFNLRAVFGDFRL